MIGVNFRDRMEQIIVDLSEVNQNKNLTKIKSMDL